MEELEILDIIFFGVLAVFLIFQLWTVLGRRTGHEEPPGDPLRRDKQESSAISSDDKIVPMPGRASGMPDDSRPIPQGATRYSGALAQTLTDLELADRAFLPDEFLTGARSAYEMIVTGFANGDKATLKPLLSGDVFDQFETVIDGREQAGQVVESSFVGIRTAEISGAALNGSTAEISIKFVSELISVTKDSDGAIVEGDPNQVREVRDVWTFAREVGSRNPNWVLIATSADAAV